MPPSHLLASCAFFSALASLCGSLASDTDRRAPPAVLQGELTNTDAIGTSGNVRVAVVWKCGSVDDLYRVSQDVSIRRWAIRG